MKKNFKMWIGPPYFYKVLMNDNWIKMSGFDEKHIRNQLHPKKPKKVLKIRNKIEKNK